MTTRSMWINDHVHDCFECFHTRVVCPLLGKASPPKERPKISLGGRLQVTSMKHKTIDNNTKHHLASTVLETVLSAAASSDLI